MKVPAFDVGAVECTPPVWRQVNRDMMYDGWATLKTTSVSLMSSFCLCCHTSAGSISLVLSSIKSSKSLSKAFFSWGVVTRQFSKSISYTDSIRKSTKKN